MSIEDNITPEEKAKLYSEWHEQTFEKIKFEPKPKVFMHGFINIFNTLIGQKEINRRVFWLFIFGCLLFILTSTMMLSYSEELLAPRAMGIVHRISAGIFLAAVIANIIYDLGWGGGDKSM